MPHCKSLVHKNLRRSVSLCVWGDVCRKNNMISPQNGHRSGVKYWWHIILTYIAFSEHVFTKSSAFHAARLRAPSLGRPSSAQLSLSSVGAPPLRLSTHSLSKALSSLKVVCSSTSPWRKRRGTNGLACAFLYSPSGAERRGSRGGAQAPAYLSESTSTATARSASGPSPAMCSLRRTCGKPFSTFRTRQSWRNIQFITSPFCVMRA